MAAVHKSAYKLLCGKKLGDGFNRNVYECNIMEDWVVKIERSDSDDFANVRERAFWREYEGDKTISKWLAPCGDISNDGRIMLQRKVQPLPKGYVVPRTLPEFLTDVKLSNFGLLDGKLVCVDYADVVIEPSVKRVKAYFLEF